MDSYDGFLPIGSVVEVKNHVGPYMIIQMGLDGKYYLGVKHPLGFEEEKKIIKFGIPDIIKVYFIGYINKEIEIKRQTLNIKKLVGGKENG